MISSFVSGFQNSSVFYKRTFPEKSLLKQKKSSLGACQQLFPSFAEVIFTNPGV